MDWLAFFKLPYLRDEWQAIVDRAAPETKVIYRSGGLEVDYVEPLKVEIAAVHHVNGTGFGDQQVEDIDVVQPSVGDVNEARDGTAQIEQRMHLHCGLGGAERRPRENRQAKIDCR